MKLKTLASLFALVVLSTANSPLSTYGQGSLTPPVGTPAPVMKSLDQIEPRIPLVAGSPGVDYSNGCYTITQPGSYYLTGNITVNSGLTGVSFHSSGVTLDLNGFTISGVSSNCYGIADSEEFGGPGNRIFNGTIRTCTYGIAVNGQFMIDSVRVLNCSQEGIYIYGQNSVISRCTVQSCPHGILCGDNVTVTDCRVLQCLGTSSAFGIRVDSGSISRCAVSYVSAQTVQGIINYNGFVSDCEVSGITSTTGACQGIVAAQVRNCSVNNLNSGNNISTGIQANGHGLVSDCKIGNVTGVSGCFGINASTYRLQVRGCEVNELLGASGSVCGINSSTQGSVFTDCVVTSVTNNAAGLNCYGIYSMGGVVDHCAVTRVKSYGIYAANDTTVLNSRVYGVKDSNAGTGIYVTGAGNRVDGNSVTGCYKGIEMLGATTAMVVRNHSSGNTTGYVGLPAGFVISGYASMASSTNPFVNVDL